MQPQYRPQWEHQHQTMGYQKTRWWDRLHHHRRSILSFSFHALLIIHWLDAIRAKQHRINHDGKDKLDRFETSLIERSFELTEMILKQQQITCILDKNRKWIEKGCVFFSKFTLVRKEFIHFVNVFFCMWSRSSCKTLMRPCSNLSTSSRCDMVITFFAIQHN